MAKTRAVTLTIEGMKCAGCVASVERLLKQCEGVEAATVNLLLERATVFTQADGDKIIPCLLQRLQQGGYSAQVQGETDLPALGQPPIETPSHRDIWVSLALITVALVGHLGHHHPILSNDYFHGLLATLALAVPGRPLLVDGAKMLGRGTPNMNSLVGIGIVAAYLCSVVALFFPGTGWHCFFEEPVMLLGFILLGKALEARAKRRTTDSLRALLALQPPTARVVVGDQAFVIPLAR